MAIAVGASLVLITINLRLALGSVSPVLDDIRETLGLSSSTAGLLTTAPVLCFGLAAPLAPRLARAASARRRCCCSRWAA